MQRLFCETDLFADIRKLHGAGNALPGIFYIPEAIGCEDKGDICLLTGSGIPEGVAYVHGLPERKIPDDLPDILRFGVAGVAGAQMPFEIFGKSGRLKKNLYIAGLTVAHNEQRKPSAQNVQGFFKAGIERRAFPEKRFVLGLTAAVDQAELFLFGKGRKQRCGNVRQEPAKKTFQLFCRETRFHRGIVLKIFVPGTGHNVCGIPHGAVHIKNDTVHNLPFLNPDKECCIPEI